MKRRLFVQKTSMTAAGLTLLGLHSCSKGSDNTENQNSEETIETAASPALFFELSLAQWSLHSQIRGGQIDFLDFAKKGEYFGVKALEYVSQLFPDEKFTDDILKELNQRADEHGMVNHLIMIDHNGDLGVLNETERMQAIENHKQWIDAAATLGCSTVRVNMEGDGTEDEIKTAGVDSLGQLSEYASQHNINVVVENHGGLSSNVDWLVSVLSEVNMDNCGALPDFGNFCIEKQQNEAGEEECVNEYDRYKGVELLMPYAKGGVSAKAKKFDDQGNEVNTDYTRMMKIVKDAGFSGYIGIEYENDIADEEDNGIMKTKELLIREGSKLG